MPAKSKAQQAIMGMAHKYQKEGGKASPAVKKIAKSMKPNDVKDFASTKTKKLPEHVKKESFDKRLNDSFFSESK
jgi:hypothetical protein